MDRYNPEQKCSKCGEKVVTTGFIKACDAEEKDVSYLQRRCKRCGYIWKELPLDAREE